MATTTINNKKKRANPIVHFVAGGIGGTVGAVLTCPLEVVKTRLQSSMYRLDHGQGTLGMMRYVRWRWRWWSVVGWSMVDDGGI